MIKTIFILFVFSLTWAMPNFLFSPYFGGLEIPASPYFNEVNSMASKGLNSDNLEEYTRLVNKNNDWYDQQKKTFSKKLIFAERIKYVFMNIAIGCLILIVVFYSRCQSIIYFVVLLLFPSLLMILKIIPFGQYIFVIYISVMTIYISFLKNKNKQNKQKGSE